MFELRAGTNYPQRVADFGFSSLVTLSLVLLCIVSWFAFRASPEDRHATFLWFLGSLALAVASGFYAIRPVVPELLEVNVFFVNFFLCSGVGLHVSGLVRIDGRDRLWWIFWIPGVVASFLGAWVLKFPFGVHVQPLLIGGVLLVWISRVFFWVLGRGWGNRAPGMRRVLGFYIFAAVAAVTFGTRVEWMPLVQASTKGLFSIGLTSAVLLFLDLSLLGIGFGELLLIHDLSAMRYRREAESKLRAMIDLEEYRKLQKTLVERERDVALGRMVASVNHSLNSPLAALISANTTLGQAMRDHLPRLVEHLRSLSHRDWELVERAAGFMQPMTAHRRRQRLAAFSSWLKLRSLPDEPDSLVDTGLDLRTDLLEELVNTSNPAAVLRLLSVWADSLTARTVIDQATRKASKLLIALRDWFETGFDTEAASTPVSEVLRIQTQTLRKTYPTLSFETSLEAALSVNPPSRPLELVFQAVLENAARAAERQVIVRSFDRPDGVSIEIEDDGPGVPPKRQEFLFEPFVGASVESQSLGVSLYFSRLFLNEWGGSIAYRRERGMTRFVIELPRL